MSKAAIVAYGNNEHSIVYTSTDWMELIRILTDPAAFFQYQAMTNSSIPWTLKASATVSIVPINAAMGNAIRDTRMFRSFGLDLDGIEPDTKERVKDRDRDERDNQWALAQAYENRLYHKSSADFDNPCSKGAFVAEFALNTHVLTVRHRVPDKCIACPHNEPCKHFKGKNTQPTLIQLVDSDLAQDQVMSGNLHFDIEADTNPPRMNRAAHMMDMIENPYRIFDNLGKHILNTASVTTLNDTPIPITAPSDLQGDICYNIASRPQMIAEGMSMAGLGQGMGEDVFADQCGLCIDGQTYYLGPNEWSIGGVIYKCYDSP